MVNSYSLHVQRVKSARRPNELHEAIDELLGAKDAQKGVPIPEEQEDLEWKMRPRVDRTFFAQKKFKIKGGREKKICEICS